MNKRIIAITGMPGARKSDATAILASLGIPSLNMSTIIREEILRVNMSLTSASYYRMGLELRKRYGGTVLAERALSCIPTGEPFSVVDGIRTLDEVEYFRTNADFCRVVCIHAPRPIRFARMRKRSDQDLQCREELVRQDKENLSLGIGNVIALADYVVINGDYAPTIFEDGVIDIYNHILSEIADETKFISDSDSRVGL